VKRLAAFLILGVSLTACSSTPDPIPDCEIPAPMAEVGHAVSVPEMPAETRRFEQGAEFDLEGLLQLQRVHEAGKANFKVADENAAALEARNEEVNQLIECARYQNVWIQVHAEDLKDEKREHWIDNLTHQALIALGVIAVAL